MYLTYTDIVKLKLFADKAQLDNTRFNTIINDDLTSHSKKMMRVGDNYYRGDQDILKRKKGFYDHPRPEGGGNATYSEGIFREDKECVNRKIPVKFFRLLVKQKMEYIAGRPVVVNTSDKNNAFLKAITDIIGYRFDVMMPEVVSAASCKGVAWLHPFINEMGEFDYLVISANEIIPVYDSSYQRELLYVIRYYTYELISPGGQRNTRYKLEWWDKEKVEYWSQDINNNWALDEDCNPNPCWHWYEFNTASPDKTQALSWGRVPFVALQNNEESASDLVDIKELIDIYDLAYSDFANNLEEIQEAVWKLKGYAGESLREAMINMRMYKGVIVDGEGDVEALRADIPVEARDKFLTLTRKLIFLLGRGVDTLDENTIGDQSGAALEFVYNGLDKKADAFIRYANLALEGFFEFVTQWINLTQHKQYNYKNLTFKFNKSIIANQLQIVQMGVNSLSIRSRKTIVENHPWVEDADEELKRIEEQQENEPKLNLSDFKNANVNVNANKKPEPVV